MDAPTARRGRLHGRTALVTGASSGIGEAFARRLAARGADLVLAARRRDALETLGGELRARHGARVEVVDIDLGEADAGERLLAQIAALRVDIDILVNSAGFGMHGDVADIDPARLRQMLLVNVAGLADLTSRVLPGMVQRRSGTIINLASTAALQPLPHMAAYAASKAFVLSFSEAVATEVRATGVRVIAVCPGPTSTAFFDIVGTDAASPGTRRTTEHVVDSTFRALARGRSSVIDGRFNTVQGFMPRILGRRLSAILAGRLVAE